MTAFDNARFDAMCAASRVRQARRSLKCWTDALTRSDITNEERDFLTRCVPAAEAELASAIANLNNYR